MKTVGGGRSAHRFPAHSGTQGRVRS